jgi:hypothetical protein
MNSTALLTVPLDVVENARRNHQLQYRNNRSFDYTYAAFPVIPHTINQWADHGIDLSDRFVEQLWDSYAAKKADSKQGEIARTQKLVLDALKAVYDQSAFAEYTGCQVVYRPADDLIGRDLQIHIPNHGNWFVQMRVRVGQDYSHIKQRRQASRPDAGFVIDACADVADLDTDHQPYVPQRRWYEQIVEQIKQLRTQQIVDELLPTAQEVSL